MITRKDVLNEFIYDRNNGKFYWKKDTKTGRGKSGQEAGHTVYKDDGMMYRRIYLNGGRYFTHRIVWLVEAGDYPKSGLDHYDGNGMNNRFDNLREVSAVINGQNRKIGSNNTSGHMGVHWRKSIHRWVADIRVDTKLIYLGCFKNIRDAVKCRKNGEIKYGFNENHGRRR